VTVTAAVPALPASSFFFAARTTRKSAVTKEAMVGLLVRSSSQLVGFRPALVAVATVVTRPSVIARNERLRM
jgi:hypothetical protein